MRSSPRALTHGRRLYVACSGSNNVYTIDTRTNQIMFPPVQVGAYPIHVAVAPKGDRIFVTNFYGNSVSVINVSNTTTPTVEKTFTVDWKPIAVKPGGRYLYVSQYADQKVKVFDIEDDFAEVDTVFTGEMGATQPIFITFTPDGKRAFVANEGGVDFGRHVERVLILLAAVRLPERRAELALDDGADDRPGVLGDEQGEQPLRLGLVMGAQEGQQQLVELSCDGLPVHRWPKLRERL